MRVGMDIRALDRASPTGIGKYIHSLLRKYAELDGANSYYLYYPWRKNSRRWIRNEFGDGCLAKMSWVPECLDANRFNRLWLSRYLPRRISRDGVEVFHGPSFFLPETRQAKRIVTIHDLSPVLLPHLYEGITSHAIIESTRAAVDQADAVIADSENTRSDVLNTYCVPPEKVRTIPIGVDDLYREPCPRATAESVRRRYDLPEVFVLHVGSYHPRKNVGALLKAIAILKSQGVSVNVVLSGKKTRYFETLKRMVCDLHLEDLVVSLGYVSDEEIRGLYSLASALAYPSLYEGFCLPVAEAMAAGVPCVVSNRACLPEIAGEAAMIIDPDRPEEFAGSIRSMLEDQEVRESLIARGRGRAAGYSWSDTARRTLELYRDVAGA